MWLYGDLECRSHVKLDQAGTYRYAEQSEILLFPYALGDGSVQCWDAYHHKRMPDELREALAGDATLVFHNAMFDRTILRHALMELPVERFYCTMTQAYAHGMPGALDKLGEVLGLPMDQRKIKDGERLVKLFCEKREDPDKWPAEWARFIDYAKGDVEAMREVHKRLPTVNYQGKELALYHLDQKINDRGMHIDLTLCKKAQQASSAARDKLNARIEALTDGRVTKVTQTARITNEVDTLDALTKEDVKQALAGDPDPVTRELLLLRQQGNRSSNAKYERLQRYVSSDGRLRGTLIMDGAQRTGRWAGRGPQPHNFPRPDMPAELIVQGVEALLQEQADLLFDDVVGLCTNTLRSAISAAPGNKLVIADWSNIEGRVLAWLANETSKLDAFNAFDAGEGPDLYRLGYSKATGVPLAQVTSFQRQIGKGMELSNQYGGGVGAAVGIGVSYGLDLVEIGREVPKLLPESRIEAARKVWRRAIKENKTYDLPEAQYVACEALKRLWRDTNPATVQFWRALEDGARLALTNKGKRYQVGKVWWQCAGSTLMMGLPSGRRLIYPNARIDSNGISFMKTPGWQREWVWGGFFAENVTQAVARDVLRDAMFAAENAGFRIVLHVHDEMITEVGTNSGLDEKLLCEIMERPLPWAPGLPLAAEGYVGQRFKKGA